MAKLKPIGPNNESPVNSLVRNVLLEQKGSTHEHEMDSYKLKWTFANEVELVFVVLYQKLIPLLYVDALLESMKKQFLKLFDEEIKAMSCRNFPVPFDEHFDKCLRKASKNAMLAKRNSDLSRSSSKNSLKLAPRKSQENLTDRGEGDGKDTEGKAAASEEKEDAVGSQAISRSRLSRQQSNSGGGVRRRTRPSKVSSKELTNEPSQSSSRGPKKPTQWHDMPSKRLSKKEADKLDRSSSTMGQDDIDELQNKEYEAKYLPDTNEVAEWDEEDDQDEEALEEEDAKAISGFFGATQAFFQKTMDSATGNMVVSSEDLAPVMEEMRTRLVGKNVASECAEQICMSVRSSLEGQKLASFTRVRTAVVEALKAAVLRVLSPTKSTDILHQVLSNKRAGTGTPYSIVFVGINGVGKSTSLAKVAYYLKHHGVKVAIAACDTFRSGAVEQLRSHSRCLDVPLYEKGYLKDPGEVAKAAMEEAIADKAECLLIDTAGRMQNNDKLMKELANLVNKNNPSLILFVGEALVGNDGIDQLSMFDKALKTYLPRNNPRSIDGIVLTKFDTIDDKVGATLSMSYKTGQPVMFVGTGQKYTHLRKLNVHSVIRALFS
eukprot:CAMPEP_0185773752 /NCGR_PEP_ID=MMETSP1174-20130828/74945_1 /TAXON_ID=35687 /ORGANISM="Dictyocha speculum, Strain CCMP1381" /LENGTH=604 /DNA_ID=CAMNT_0028460569 /DNA_START=35 /DNA_END=1849 /DNA_ORIENTATION=+